MPQITTFTLNDREATPVGHVFTSFRKDSGVVSAVRSTGTPGTDEVVTISSRDANKTRKIRFKLVVPTVQTETINGITHPKIVRVASVDLNISFDHYASLQERKNIIGMLYAALASGQTLLDPVFTGAEAPY